MAAQMSEHDTRPRSRRALLAGALGGLGALAAGMIGRSRPAHGDNGDPVILGAANVGNGTKIESGFEDTALLLQSGDVGLNSFGGVTGVVGRTNAEVGVWGSALHGVGVLGSSDSGPGVLGRSRSDYAGLFEGKVYTTSYIDLKERLTPAKPALNHARLFVLDNGANRTQLCVKFPNGVVRVLATA